MWSPFRKKNPPDGPPALGVVVRDGLAGLALYDPDQEPRTVTLALENIDQETLRGFLGETKPRTIGVNGLANDDPLRWLPDTTCTVRPVPTADLILASLDLQGPGLAVFADQFMGAAARDPDGQTWVAGDWPASFARSGSVHDVLLRCAHALAEIVDGRSKTSVLHTALPRAMSAETPSEFLQWVHAFPSPGQEPLVREVLKHLSQAAATGDAVAQRLISVTGADIGRCGEAAVSTLGLQAEKERLQVCFGGQIFSLQGIRGPFKKRIISLCPDARFRLEQPVPPALTVARLACGRTG